MVTRLPLAVLAAVALLAGCQASTPGFQPDGPWQVSEPRTMAADVPPYHRDAFGTGWAHAHGNCDTREVVLERDAGNAAVDADGDGCRDDGPIVDLYSGQETDPHHADIDHVYPLALAWKEGAWKWAPVQRRAFYNDVANLRGVGESMNRSKGDRGPSQFTPPNPAGRCTYARIFEATAHRWHLGMDPGDQAAIREMETTC